ncbi:hypothetical protein, partial [Planktotalea sp.]|uniref:hypothetical protein n=1 Tax=Planktotalea sp. TaxID=2029877 RepID=UPI0025D8E972
VASRPPFAIARIWEAVTPAMVGAFPGSGAATTGVVLLHADKNEVETSTGAAIKGFSAFGLSKIF